MTKIKRKIIKKNAKKNVFWYIGIHKTRFGKAIIFSTAKKPTTSAYTRKYKKVIGPFMTYNAAVTHRYEKGLLKRKNPVSKSRDKGIVIYDNIKAIEAEKGSDSLFPGELFRHDFTKTKAKVIGMPDGSLVIKGNRRLHKRFNYPEKNKK